MSSSEDVSLPWSKGEELFCIPMFKVLSIQRYQSSVINVFLLINACQFQELLYRNYLNINIGQKHFDMHHFWHTLIIYDIMIDIPFNH